MKRKPVRCRANKFLLVPKPRLIGQESFWGPSEDPWGGESPTAVELVSLIQEKIAVHREEIADAEDLLRQIADQIPSVAQMLPKQRLVVVR